ncbi:MAG: hypothetical protein DWQ47_07180 [Acidobacteria bacterium]|nr:MAG: hypothetical protein DWQ32_15280 [Acidobacteriota bacterium]REJ99292.1 MAG: hypothetical protein DWQ38_14695 [Acidobacteriota bacterium]REK15988.1 MAG: hypothetical protein DWQ43_02990 [Acidobacteriota bacterium]REK43669.1 MAG: hypothetical protein DWQ47_07180 [Acidobacteriota bacterium]
MNLKDIRTKETSRLGIWSTTLMSLLVLASATMINAQFNKEISWANSLIEKSNATSSTDRADLIRKIIDKVEPYRHKDPDANSLLTVLEIQESLLRSESGPGIEASTGPERLKSLDAARMELLEATASSIEHVDPRSLTPQQVEQFAGLLKNVAKLYEGVKDPSLLGPESTALSRIFGFAEGVLKLRNSAEDPSTKRIFDGLSNTLGAFEPVVRRLNVSIPSPFKAIDIPAGIVTAINDNTAMAWYESSLAIEELGNAIAGDPDALARLQRHADAIEQILSPETYGRAILDSVSDGLVGRIPLFVSLRDLLGFSPRNWLEGRWIAVENNLGGRPSDQVGLVVRFVRKGRTGSVSGYIVTPTEQSFKARFLIGEEIFKGYTQKSGGIVWDYFATGGRCLSSSYHYMDEKGDKTWTNAVLIVPKGKSYLEVGCNFWLLRFKKISN